MTLLRGLNPSVLQAPYRDSGDKSAFSQVSLEDVWGALRMCGTDIRSRWSVSQTVSSRGPSVFAHSHGAVRVKRVLIHRLTHISKIQKLCTLGVFHNSF